jgi:hypothetical protein
MSRAQTVRVGTCISLSLSPEAAEAFLPAACRMYVHICMYVHTCTETIHITGVDKSPHVHESSSPGKRKDLTCRLKKKDKKKWSIQGSNL